MKKIIFIFLVLLASGKSMAQQITDIPDYRFEQALLDLGIDSDLTLNGHILTSDALLVTEMIITPFTLTNYPYPAGDISDSEGMIHDLTGIEAFVNLEKLIINTTMVDNLNLSNLVNLKHLNVVDNMLTSIDVSNNSNLEYIKISDWGDVLPMNSITELDLSQNPNINTIYAPGVQKINLNNNNNNVNMLINVGCLCTGYLPEDIVGSVCIKVDNVALAQNAQTPYDEWSLYHANIALNYTNDLPQCSLLGSSTFNRNKITVYPNPIQTDILYFKSDDSSLFKVEIFDYLGRKIVEKEKVIDSINVSGLDKGNYLIKILSGSGTQTEKLIVE
jgi:hypothetical protein